MLNLNEQCPNRGPALTHIRDSRQFPDGRCVYCGAGAPMHKHVCSGYACITTIMAPAGSGKVYCGRCTSIRNDSGVSHLIEGHSEQAILMCPPCEEAAA